MSGKDNTGWKRGAGPYSRNYAKFDGWKPTPFGGREIYGKIDGVGDYETARAFTGEVSRSNNHPSQGKYSKRGEGAYSKSSRSGSGSQGGPNGGQKVSD